MTIKKILTAALCAAMVFGLVACGSKTEQKESSVAPGESESSDTEMVGENVQIPNPWMECADVAEATKNSGIPLEVPESIGNYKISLVQNCGEEMIDVIYTDEEENEIRIRKGVSGEDITGDYNEYSEVNEVTVGEYTVTEKGDDGFVKLAVWTSGAYDLVVYADGMNAEAVAEVISQVK